MEVRGDRIEKALAARVREAREAAGLSKVEMADALGLSKQGYGPYESHGRFTIDQLFALQRILGCSVAWFLGLPTELARDEDELLALYRNVPEAARGPLLRIVRAYVGGHGSE